MDTLYFQMLTEKVSGVPAAFRFYLDESGFQDWADRRERTVIVPSTYTADKIEIPIDRDVKRSSLLVCIAADGAYLKLLLILPRKTIEKELFEQGITEESARFVYQEHNFTTTILFNDWSQGVRPGLEKST
jgi:hypothetical protein